VTSTNEQSGVMTLIDVIADMRPRLLAVARSMRAAEPEDLVQTTIEIAIRHAAQLGDPSRLWPWLVTIQTRELFRWSRRLRMVAHLREPRDSVAELESYADLRAAIATLPLRMRASIVLHHMAGLSVAETAQALGTSENTVRTQLRLGLRRLRETLR
jgi:RNA polymerase sigma factor (sigma-70 family)